MTSLAGCTVLADLDDFGPGIPACDEGAENEIRDLWLVLDAMGMHQFQRTEVRVVADGADDNDFLVALAIIDGLPSADYTLFMPRAIPSGAHRVDFFADLNRNGRYDPPSADHAWSLSGCVSGAYRFTHDPAFVDIDDPAPRPVGGDLTLRLTHFAAHLGDLMEVFVYADDGSDRMVGYYRLAELSTEDATLIIPGVLEPQADYSVAFYADLSGNKRYDPPEVDHAWLLQGTADASGLALEFMHTLQFNEIGAFVPETSK